MDDSNSQETVVCENNAQLSHRVREEKSSESQSKHRVIQSKKAKALELVLGKTPEVSEIDLLKQTVSKNPKAHFNRKKYDSVY